MSHLHSRIGIRLFGGLIGLCLAVVPAMSAELPSDAKKLLESLPEKRLTVGLILFRSMEVSDSFKSVQALKQGIDVPALQARIPLETRVYGSAGVLSNRNETISPFSPNRTDATSYLLGVSTMFFTGTQLKLELTHGKNDITFASLAPQNYYESKMALTLSQSLWRDAFGYGTRQGLRAGELSRGAQEAGYYEAVQNWMDQLLQVYYRAWTLQAQTQAAASSVERRKKLLEVTEIKARRGTSEKQDILQVKSALIGSEVQYGAVRQSLSEIWRSLVTSLKLPKEWLEVDPVLIPMSPDEPVKEALKACATQKTAPSESATQIKYRLQAEAANAQLNRAENSRWPDLKLNASVAGNGVDSTAVPTFSEATTVRHPYWMVSGTLTFPILSYAERADVQTSRMARDRAEAMAAQATTDLESDWINACADLKRLKENEERLEQVHLNQAERAKIEEERFRIGRTTTLGVIQAADDATSAEVNLRDAEARLRLGAWRVRKLVDGYEDYLKQLVARKGSGL